MKMRTVFLRVVLVAAVSLLMASVFGRAVTTGAAWHFTAPVTGYYIVNACITFNTTAKIGRASCRERVSFGV